MKIVKPETGFEHLSAKAERRPEPDVFPEGKCTRIMIPLTGKDYFIPDYKICDGGLPPFSFLLPLAYSEVKIGNDIVSIQKHESVQIVGLGVVIEIYPQPGWWAKRDEGSLV